MLLPSYGRRPDVEPVRGFNRALHALQVASWSAIEPGDGSSGPKVGPNGACFGRINFTTSEQILDQVIDRIADTAVECR